MKITHMRGIVIHFRIIITGDAFESGEGVDTEENWPYLLDNRKIDDITYDVLNLSITGWGQQHYSRVLAEYVPIYKPDLIIVCMFVNDLTDVYIDDNTFNHVIGFSKADAFSLKAKLSLMHYSKWMQLKTRSLICSLFSFLPPPESYYLAHTDKLEKQGRDKLMAGAEIAKKNIEDIQKLSKEYNSEIFVLLVPSSIQVAPLEELNYINSKNFDINSDKFDLNQLRILSLIYVMVWIYQAMIYEYHFKCIMEKDLPTE